MPDQTQNRTRVVICRSNPVSPDPRVEKEARALVEMGFEVWVIAWDRSGNFPDREEQDGYTIHRLPIEAEYARGMANLPALIRWQIGLTWWLFRHRKEYQLIHACDFDTVLPALLWKGLLGKKVVYDIFDFYADHLLRTPAWLLKRIRVVDLWAVGRSDAVIIVDQSREEQIRAGDPKNLTVIYNSPYDTGLVPAEDGDREGLRIVYVGLLQRERGLFEFLHLLRGHPEWTLDLAGFGGDVKAIRTLARDMPNVRWHGRVPYSKTLQLTAASDLSLATYDPGVENHRFASPNKIFEAMMLAKPVVVARDTNMDRIVERWDCGVVVEYGSETDLARALRRLEEDPDLRERLGRNGRRAYEQEYAWEKMVTRLEGVYGAVLENGV